MRDRLRPLVWVWPPGVLGAYACFHPAIFRVYPSDEGHWSSQAFFSYGLKILAGAATALWIVWIAKRLGARWTVNIIPTGSSLEADTVGASAGLGALALSVFALGSLRLWYIAVFVGFLGVLTLEALHRGAGRLPWLDDAQQIFSETPVLLTVTLAVFLGVILLADLAPEIFYDALYYHLAVPDLYRQSHQLIQLPNAMFSNFVFSVQMLYGLAITVGNTLTAKLLHGGSIVLLSGALVAFGRRTASSASGVLAALLIVSMPLVGINAATAGIDGFCMLFQLTGAIVLASALHEGGDLRWRLAGFLLGVSASCRIPSWMLVPLAAILIGIAHRGAPKRALSRALLNFLIPAFAVLSIFWSRNAVAHGNPFYPLGAMRWGHPLITLGQWQTFLADAHHRSLRTGRDWLELLKHPWTLTMRGETNSDYVGPLLLLCAPGLFMWRHFSLETRWLAIYGGMGWLVWALTSTMPRYGLASLVLLAPAMAEGSWRLANGSRAGRLIGGLALCGGLASNVVALSCNLYSKAGLKVVTGVFPESGYLSEPHPSYSAPPYAAIQWMNTHLPINEKVLFVGDPRTYYLQRMVIAGAASDIQPLTTAIRATDSAEALWTQLRAQRLTTLFFNATEAQRTRAYHLFDWTPAEWDRFYNFLGRYTDLLWQNHGDAGDQFIFQLRETPLTVAFPTPNPLAALEPGHGH